MGNSARGKAPESAHRVTTSAATYANGLRGYPIDAAPVLFITGIASCADATAAVLSSVGRVLASGEPASRTRPRATVVSITSTPSAVRADPVRAAHSHTDKIAQHTFATRSVHADSMLAPQRLKRGSCSWQGAAGDLLALGQLLVCRAVTITKLCRILRHGSAAELAW